MKSKNIIVPLVLYPFDVMLSFGETDVKLENTLKPYLSQYALDEGLHLIDEGTYAKCIHYSTGHTIIRMRQIPKTAEHYAALQHEIFHAADFILARVGMELCPKSREAYAYLIDYITKQVYTQI